MSALDACRMPGRDGLAGWRDTDELRGRERDRSRDGQGASQERLRQDRLPAPERAHGLGLSNPDPGLEPSWRRRGGNEERPAGAPLFTAKTPAAGGPGGSPQRAGYLLAGGEVQAGFGLSWIAAPIAAASSATRFRRDDCRAPARGDEDAFQEEAGLVLDDRDVGR